MAVPSAKFISRKQWIVAGTDDMFIQVYIYNNIPKMNPLSADTNYIRSAVVHHTFPCVMSSSDDMLMKVWDRGKGWDGTQISEGHSHYADAYDHQPQGQ